MQYKKGDVVYIVKDLVDAHQNKDNILQWMGHCRLTFNTAYTVYESGGAHIRFLEDASKLLYPVRIVKPVTVMRSDLVSIPKSSDERKEIARKILGDLFSSDEKYSQYLKIYDS